MFTLTAAEFAATVERAEKVNARAVKRGFTGRLVVEGTPRTRLVEIGAADGVITIPETVYDVVITGDAPRYSGWEFLARVDNDAEVGITVAVAPGASVAVDRDRIDGNRCQHCNTTRQRKTTYMVVNTETGEQVQVGSTCIKDFTGWTGKVVFLTEDDVRDEDGGWGGLGGGETRYNLLGVLAVAWASIKVHGWAPASGYGQTTRERVVAILSPRNAADWALVAEVAPHIEDAVALGGQVRDFILSDAFTGTGDYVLNLRAVMAAETITARHLGLAVSAPQAMMRAQERTLVAKAADALPASDYIGAVKGKVTVTGTITGIRWIEGDYGTSVLYMIRDQRSGAIVKWFASREALGDKQGVEVTIAGTVKAHEEYQGTRQTVLTRCKAV